MDHFLKLSIEHKDDADPSRVVNESDIRCMGMDMFGGGITTTSKTLKMMLALLVCHPEIQDQR